MAAAIAGSCAGAASPPGRTELPTETNGSVATPRGSTCNLVTADDLTAIWGVKMKAAPAPDNECTWSASTGLPSFSTRFEPTNLPAARQLLGNDADVTIEGNPAVVGYLTGVAVYVRRGSFDLVVQTIQLEDTPDNRAKVIATAEKALSRAP